MLFIFISFFFSIISTIDLCVETLVVEFIDNSTAMFLVVQHIVLTHACSLFLFLFFFLSITSTSDLS